MSPELRDRAHAFRTFECYECGGGMDLDGPAVVVRACICGRRSIQEAALAILDRLEHADPDLYRLALEGEARIVVVQDGEDGWAWWVVMDSESDAGPDYPPGAEVFNPEYLDPEAT